MPLSKDSQGGGTNTDGRKSAEYCSRCFQMGKFTEPDITLSKMQEKVKGKLKGMGFPGFMTGFFTKKIPQLKRWQR